jgi:hypothetical protein
MVCDITCLVERHCCQHFRGICSFHFRIEASGSRFLESGVDLATKLHGVILSLLIPTVCIEIIIFKL